MLRGRTAPWHIIEATDRRYRDLAAGKILLGALEVRREKVARGSKLRIAARAEVKRRRSAKPTIDRADSILAHVDLSPSLSESDYDKQLDALQTKLSKLAWLAQRKQRTTVLLFEGWDAAGKGSAIRRVTHAMDPRLYRVVGIAAPSDEERSHHYLWRFWRQLPRAGFATIFDRSWYGRVLVERVEGFAPTEDWERAYHEINEFDEQLGEHGTTLLKFWLHISPKEQLRRFKERERVAYTQDKITAEDWRNRARWPAYQLAVDAMIAKCSTEFAPWTVIAGNDKRYARVQILRTIVERLEQVL